MQVRAHEAADLQARLVAHVAAWLSEAGMPKINPMIRDGNVAFRGFYPRLGQAVAPLQRSGPILAHPEPRVP